MAAEYADQSNTIIGGYTMLKQEEMIEVRVAEKNSAASAVVTAGQGINMICKGSKVTGNMLISQDLQMYGDLVGDITADNNASIFIQGTCKGNIDAKGGSVEIEGEMSGGNISAGGYVKVTGKFLGGKIQAKDKIHMDGEFAGSLESNVVELGASARGKGEILYKETLCIQQGAKMEGNVTRVGAERISVPMPEQKPELKEEPKPKKSFFASKEPKPKKGFFSS
jgi:cytoskeletal protein CcmA (bactofilin family)